ncbi:HipA N-terminal domain-containing protein [soil metagenome]
MRSAVVYMHDKIAGKLLETEEGYEFCYDTEYLATSNVEPISLTFPLSSKKYSYRYLFPFFDGLIPEGWLLAVATDNWKLNPRDRMGLLLKCCHDCIGAVSIKEEGENE